MPLHWSVVFPPPLQEVLLGSRFRCWLFAAVFGLLVQVCLAQNTPKVSLDNSETLFTVLTAVNACGYDQELGVSDPVRAQVRSEVARVIAASADTSEVTNEMCKYYQEHQSTDQSHELAQYVSLALYLSGPPNFTPKAKEAEMPPDAVR